MKKDFSLSRRAFLRSMVAAAAATVIAAPVIESLTTVFTPPPGGWAKPLRFHPDAFSFVARPLEDGVSIRYIKRHDMQYAIKTDALPTRLDLLYGWAPISQETYARIVGVE